MNTPPYFALMKDLHNRNPMTETMHIQLHGSDSAQLPLSGGMKWLIEFPPAWSWFSSWSPGSVPGISRNRHLGRVHQHRLLQHPALSAQVHPRCFRCLLRHLTSLLARHARQHLWLRLHQQRSPSQPLTSRHSVQPLQCPSSQQPLQPNTEDDIQCASLYGTFTMLCPRLVASAVATTTTCAVVVGGGWKAGCLASKRCWSQQQLVLHFRLPPWLCHHPPSLFHFHLVPSLCMGVICLLNWIHLTCHSMYQRRLLFWRRVLLNVLGKEVLQLCKRHRLLNASCLSVSLPLSLSISLSLCLSVSLSLCLSVSLSLCLSVSLSLCLSVSLSLCLSVSLYIYIHIYIHVSLSLSLSLARSLSLFSLSLCLNLSLSGNDSFDFYPEKTRLQHPQFSQAA